MLKAYLSMLSRYKDIISEQVPREEHSDDYTHHVLTAHPNAENLYSIIQLQKSAKKATKK